MTKKTGKIDKSDRWIYIGETYNENGVIIEKNHIYKSLEYFKTVLEKEAELKSLFIDIKDFNKVKRKKKSKKNIILKKKNKIKTENTSEETPKSDNSKEKSKDKGKKEVNKDV